MIFLRLSRRIKVETVQLNRRKALVNQMKKKDRVPESDKRVEVWRHGGRK